MDKQGKVIDFSNVKLIDPEINFESDYINIDIFKGERLFVYGGNDRLRTLFLMSILGFVQPEEGSILVNNNKIPYSSLNDIQKYRRNIGYANSQNGLLKSLTVRENIMLPMQIKGVFSDSEIDCKVSKILSLFDIETDPEREAWGLEKVEEKKILLGRAVSSEPAILLIDDPTSYIELKDRDIVRSLIDNIIPENFIDMSKVSVVITTEEEHWGVNTGDAVFMLRSLT